MTVSRRTFMAGLTGLLLLPLPVRAHSPVIVPENLLPPVPDLARLARLARARFAGQPLPAPLTRAITSGNAESALGKIIEADFRLQRVVYLDGWMLSDAEARLCALYAGTDAELIRG